MSKKQPYEMADMPIEKGYLGSGDVYRADNGLIVIHHEQSGMLYALKGKKVKRRAHPGGIPKNWLGRRVNHFALFVKPPPKPKAPKGRVAKEFA